MDTRATHSGRRARGPAALLGLILVVALAACGSSGGSKGSGSSSTTSGAGGARTACSKAADLALDRNDAIQKVMASEGEGQNHAAKLTQAMIDEDTAATTKAKAAMQEHIDQRKSLDAELATAEQKYATALAACKKASGGTGVVQECQDLFAAVEHEGGHLTEGLSGAEQAFAARRQAVTAVEQQDFDAFKAAITDSSGHVDAVNALSNDIDEAYQEVETTYDACQDRLAGRTPTSTTTAPTSSTTAGAAGGATTVDALASAVGCTGVTPTTPTGGATAQATCTVNGGPVVLQTHSQPVTDMTAVETACGNAGPGPSGNSYVWTVGYGDDWVVASSDTKATDAVLSATKQLDGQVTITFC